MPTIGNPERNPHLWLLARRQVEKEMLDSGWNPHSKKFDRVKMKKALKRYRELQQ